MARSLGMYISFFFHFLRSLTRKLSRSRTFLVLGLTNNNDNNNNDDDDDNDNNNNTNTTTTNNKCSLARLTSSS